MQVRTLLRTIGEAESLNRSLWGESLVLVLNQHLADENKLPLTCTVVDVRKAFRQLSIGVRNRILDAEVDLELMTIELAEPGNNNSRKVLLATSLLTVAILMFFTYLLEAGATNPDPSLFLKVLSAIAPTLLELVP